MLKGVKYWNDWPRKLAGWFLTQWDLKHLIFWMETSNKNHSCKCFTYNFFLSFVIVFLFLFTKKKKISRNSPKKCFYQYLKHLTFCIHLQFSIGRWLVENIPLCPDEKCQCQAHLPPPPPPPPRSSLKSQKQTRKCRKTLEIFPNGTRISIQMAWFSFFWLIGTIYFPPLHCIAHYSK